MRSFFTQLSTAAVIGAIVLSVILAWNPDFLARLNSRGKTGTHAIRGTAGVTVPYVGGTGAEVRLYVLTGTGDRGRLKLIASRPVTGDSPVHVGRTVGGGNTAGELAVSDPEQTVSRDACEIRLKGSRLTLKCGKKAELYRAKKWCDPRGGRAEFEKDFREHLRPGETVDVHSGQMVRIGKRHYLGFEGGGEGNGAV